MYPQLQQVAALLVAQGEPSGGGFSLGGLILPAIFLGIFYFVYIRPTGKERKRHEELMTSLKRGDEVVLQSGIIGKVGDISDKTIHLELARNVKLEVLKTAVARRRDDLKLASDKKGAEPSKK